MENKELEKMKDKEKPLSERVHVGNKEIDLPPYIDKKDVALAVKMLKEEIHKDSEDRNGVYSIPVIMLMTQIDEIFGSFE